MTELKQLEGRWDRVRTRLRSVLGEEVYQSWFAKIELVSVEGGTVNLSVPTPFLRTWIQNHFADTLRDCAGAEIEGAQRIGLTVRQPVRPVGKSAEAPEPTVAVESPRRPFAASRSVETSASVVPETSGFAGSPLDRRANFETFVVGPSNRLAQAAARQVAETVHSSQQHRISPLYLHSQVGLGKTHLLQAIAWEVKRRSAGAQVLYLTAERFRYKFVEALRREDALSFKEHLRNIDVLLIDDLEFLQGQKTEQEFGDTLNALLDGGKVVVVAAARPPMQLEGLDQRIRSRLSGGLVASIGPLDYELRLRILERRVEEKRLTDPSFDIGKEVLEHLAKRLTEGGRELDGAVNRLHAACHLAGSPITIEMADTIIHDLMRGIEPRRIKIDDIQRVVAKHYGVNRQDILSQRRHRSVVVPRQIGMYLSKTLTARSLPEIGRRFGGRDHTTVLHAIRKIEGEIAKDSRLRAELEDLKKLLSM
jgi:chromosomal replication initiator protein